MEKVYVVTLKNFDDLEEFYDDMETPGGNLYIPNRKVECNLRRTISRNTHYSLTEDEAELLRRDSRVLAVELLPNELGLEPTPFWTQTGVFEKSSDIDSFDKNWGLARIIEGGQTSGWGTNSFFTQRSSTIKTTSSGKNVDVVIVDAHINPQHPEFAVNDDGTGGSRVNQIDWFQYSTALGVPTTLTYDYSDISSNHGTHVAGTIAGNTQGWARDSRIFNMEFAYAGSNFAGTNWELVLFDYIRYWHKNKDINPSTGRRNPTIVNNSWGYSLSTNFPLGDIFQVMYRGTITPLSGLPNPIKKQTLEQNGVPVPFDDYLYRVPARYSALDADVQDAINDGVLMIGSAGNSYWNCSVNTQQDWDNFIVVSGQQIFHSRGSSPAAAGNSICVGSIGTMSQEYKSTFSNYGSRVDIYAPGSNIVSSVYDATAGSEFGIQLENDPRSPQYKIGSISGTSMSSPQVSGLLACLAEQLPNMNQSIARQYILGKSKAGQISSTGGNAGDYTSLGTTSNNIYAYYNKDRPEVGMSQPKYNFNVRGSSGMTYPRVSIQRRKVS
jgi:subtilisin family serine protease